MSASQRRLHHLRVDDVKEGLRPYRNEAIQLDVSAISQPMNPGDALIHKYTILGSAPQSAHGQITEGVSLKTESDFGSDRVTAFLIQIENLGDSPIEIESSEIGPTLLGLSRSTLFTASDGKSAAWITRVSVLNHSSRRSTVGSETLSVDYDVDPGSRFPERFRLNPSESKQVRVVFKLPPGPYQFLVGFGGGVHEGKSLVSNAVSFHVDESGIPVLDQ